MTHWGKASRRFRPQTFKLRFPGAVIAIISVLVLIALLFGIAEKNLQPTIIQFAEARANLLATETIHRVLYEKVLSDVNYNELIIVHKDSEQHITMMQANTIRISRIVSQASLEIKEALKDLEEETIRFHLGRVFGSQLFANRGPYINVRLMPIASVNVNFIDEFQEAGINQVRHVLYLKINTTINILLPLISEGVCVSNLVPIAETVIVGRVPNTYFGVESGLLKGLLTH